MLTPHPSGEPGPSPERTTYDTTRALSTPAPPPTAEAVNASAPGTPTSGMRYVTRTGASAGNAAQAAPRRKAAAAPKREAPKALVKPSTASRSPGRKRVPHSSADAGANDASI